VQTLVGVHQLTSFETRIKVLRTYRVETRKSWFGPPETRKTLVSEKRIAEKTVETPTADSTYKRVKTYFTEMGITPAVMPLVMSATHKSIHWLSGPELIATHMATDFTDGERLIKGAPSSGLAGPKGVTGTYNPPVDDGTAAKPAAEPEVSPPGSKAPPLNDETPGIAATYDPATMLGPCDGSERAKRGCFGH
jgi:hypothetical protein